MASWTESLESVSIGLLTLEVNTIQKCGMSAQKMPDIPIALHSIVDCYGNYLSRRGYAVTQELRDLAAIRIRTSPPPDAATHANLMKWTPGDGTVLSPSEMTNGARSFEAFRWAAAAALRLNVNLKTGQPFQEEEYAVLVRITANCRQLTPVILDLQATNKPPLAPGRETPVFIDGTLEQTAQACFSNNLKFKTTLNVAVLVRKIWDIGTEIVLAQTAVQVDGDVVTRVSPMMEDAQRDFLLELHNSSLTTGLAQWQAMFSLLTTLLSSLGKTLFKSF